MTYQQKPIPSPRMPEYTFSSFSTKLRAGLRHLLYALTVIAGALSANDTAWSEDRIPTDSIRQSSKQVMEHSDFRSVRRRVLEEIPGDDMDQGFLEGILESIGNAISDFVAWLFATGRPRTPAPPQPVTPPTSTRSFFDNIDFGRIAAIVAILLVTAGVIRILATILRQHQHDPDRGGIPSIVERTPEITAPPGELTVSTYESRALLYSQQGDFSSAIRELLLGSMSWIERAGLIRFRKGLTNRDYVHAVWRQTDKRSAYLVTGSEFELIFFGRRPATEAMFDRCLTAFRGAFREEATPERDGR
jgi:hypothetical protein